MASAQAKNENPLISVVLPAYNAEAYLDAAIASLLTQTYRNIEVIAIDDGSSDDTLAILNRWADRDSRIRVVSRPNRGISPTRNEGISVATGVFIAQMDSDDISHPIRFERQLTHLNVHPEVNVVGSWVKNINSLDMEIGLHQLPITHEEIDETHVKGHCSIVQSTVLVRAEALREVGGYDETLAQAEDLDLWLRMAEHGRIENIPEPLVSYRLHSESISERSRQEQRGLALKVTKAAWARRGVDGAFEAMEHWRPTAAKSSQRDYQLRYGWIAWNNRNLATSRYYAVQAIKIDPLSVEAWKLLVLGTLRRPPAKEA